MMTLSDLTTRLHEADAIVQRGHYDEADRLLNSILIEAENFDHSRGNEPDNSPNDRDHSDEHTTNEKLEAMKIRASALRMRGVVAWRRGEFHVALEHLTRSLEWSERAVDHVGISKALGNIGVVHRNLSQYSEALEFFTKALAIDEAINDRAGIARNLGHIGVIHHSLSNYTLALDYYERALQLDELAQNEDGVAAKLGNIGTVHMNLSHYPQALEYYARALALAEKSGNVARIAIDLSNIGSVHLHLADYRAALDYYSRALALTEQVGNKAGTATHLGNIGSVYMSLTDYPAALNYSTRALEIQEHSGDKAAVGHQLGRIGTIHLRLDSYDEARACFERSLNIATELGDSSSIASALVSLAELHKVFGDYDRALELFQQGLQRQVEMSRKSEAANTRGAIGELYATAEWKQSDESLAEDYLQQAITASEELGTKNYELHRVLSELYERQGRWQESQQQFKAFYALKTAVLNEEARTSVQRMEQRRVIAEREQQFAIAKASADAQMHATTSLLHKVLPEAVASRMIQGEEEIADYYTSVSILFADIVGFTRISADLPAIVVVRVLNYVFGEFDRILRKHSCEKIKTIGDGYMAMCGAPSECPDHAERLAAAAVEMRRALQLPETLREHLPDNLVLGLRIGLHTGPIIAGVIGEERFVYDIYSDAVNTAARMESHGEENKIHVSSDFYRHLQNRFAMTKITDHDFVFEKRGELEIKGKGLMRTYFLEPRA